MWSRAAVRPGGGEASKTRRRLHPRLCPGRALQACPVPPVHGLLLVCAGRYRKAHSSNVHKVNHQELPRVCWEARLFVPHQLVCSDYTLLFGSSFYDYTHDIIWIIFRIKQNAEFIQKSLFVFSPLNFLWLMTTWWCTAFHQRWPEGQIKHKTPVFPLKSCSCSGEFKVEGFKDKNRKVFLFFHQKLVSIEPFGFCTFEPSPPDYPTWKSPITFRDNHLQSL